MRYVNKLALGCLGLAIAASVQAGTSKPPAITLADTSGVIIANKLKAFIGNNHVLDSKTGNLAGNGKDDILLVLDPSTNGPEKLGEGPSRIVVLLMRNAKGHLYEAARNNKLVPCARCGGLAGDPYSYTLLGNGRFTVVTEGGSRQHWANEYTFVYTPTQHDWLLQEVKRNITDKLTGQHKVLDLTANDFGQIKFSNANPSVLPETTLP